MTLTISALSLNDQALSQPFVAHFDAAGGTIGRGEQNTLMLPDPERHISRQHARISADGAGFRITNLSSANVVTVAGRALSAGESAPIRHRDQVRIGGFLLEASDSSTSPPQLAARTITEGRAAALAANVSAAADASARSGGTGAGSQPALSPARAPVEPPAAARPAGPSPATPASSASLGKPGPALADDPFADLFGPPVTPPARPAATPYGPPAALPVVSGSSGTLGGAAGSAARPPVDDPFADLLGPAVAPVAAPGRVAASAPADTAAPTPSPAAARSFGAMARAPAPADDPFGAFGDFSPVIPLPAAPVGRAPQRSAGDDALDAFVSGGGTGASPGRSASAAGAGDLLAGLGTDPLAARAVDDLLGAPGDGADALAAFLDDGPKPPASPAAGKSAAAASNHVHDLHAAFSPSSFDLGRVGGGAAAAPVAAPAQAASVRPSPAAPTRVDAKVTAPAALGAARLGEQTRVHTAPAPLGASAASSAPLAPTAPAAPAAPAAPTAPAVPAAAGAPAAAAARPLAGAPVAVRSAPMPLDSARSTGPAPLSRPAPLGDVAPAAPRVGHMAVPSGAAASGPAAAAPAASRDELWQAFCEAAGVNIDAPQGLSPEMMRVIGQLLRSAVDGTVQLMAIRSATKHELRAEMTLIQPRNNNPLKFSPDGHAALELLLQPPMRGFLPGPAAMTDAMHDLVGHSIGTMAGMRAALEGVLGRFAPTQLEGKLTGKSMIDSLIPMNRRSRLWELYLQHFEAIRDEAQDDFHTLFGRAFLAAYEQQLDRLHEQQAAATPAPGARKP